ncbi:uncharacterized protein PRCAT00002355001 [Priceomyces carsonii]|uniref:uncharacterized protein n=1 Tax=Priceomyces carsonii TaxID=28549 RepID=UPI002EDA3888|nr:unnamed protein product [Priceomyces carsonii]
MPPKKTEAVKQIRGKEAEEAVRLYLKENYRPYSILDLILNMHKKINKAAMLDILECLEKKGDIMSKTYGKLVYYVCKEEEIQDDFLNKYDISAIEKLKQQYQAIDVEIQELKKGNYLSLTFIFISTLRYPEHFY